MENAVICGVNCNENEYIDYITKYSKYYNIIGIVDETLDIHEIKYISHVPVLDMQFNEIAVFCIVADKNWDIVTSKLWAMGKERNIDFEPGWYLLQEDKHRIHYDELLKLSNQTGVSIKNHVNYFANGRLVSSVFGNCQTYYVSDMLCKVDTFVKQYMLIKMTMIADIKGDAKQNGLDERVLQCLDLFFYQHIDENNRFGKNLSTSVMLSKLKKECKKICFPNAYFVGYWPQYIPATGAALKVRGGSLYFIPYRDKMLDGMLAANTCPHDIVNKLNSDDLFSEYDIHYNVEKSLNELKMREERCDIIISDYIEENYRKKECFYSPNHPSNDVMKEVTRRLLKMISIEIEDIDDSEIEPNDTNEILLHECVRKTLNIVWTKDTYILSKYLRGTEKVSIEEYIRGYSESCFKDYKYSQNAMNITEMVDISKGVFELKNGSLIEIKEGMCSISACFVCKKDTADEVLFSIPKEFAPFKEYCFGASISNGSIIIQMDINGVATIVEADKICMKDELIVNTSYILK